MPEMQRADIQNRQKANLLRKEAENLYQESESLKKIIDLKEKELKSMSEKQATIEQLTLRLTDLRIAAAQTDAFLRERIKQKEEIARQLKNA